MKCWKCGTEIDYKANMKWCPFCGVKIRAMPDIPILEEYTQGEVNKHFKRLYELAVRILQDEVDGKVDTDNDHWCYEAVMKILGNDIWDKMKKLGI